MKYIIFDLEAICWENDRSKVNEIIEIGAVKLDENLDIIDNFSMFVRPIFNPLLSEFCKTLTSICQEDVDKSLFFSDAIKNFEKWILSSGNDVVLLSWGYYDKNQILKESEEKKYSGEIIKILEEKHFSLKHQFAKIRRERTCGMARALEKINNHRPCRWYSRRSGQCP